MDILTLTNNIVVGIAPWH